jgi:23S rRNA pseudouridine955/2504/2580 synthase
MSEADAGGVRLVEVDALGDGQRVDNFLLRELKGVPRTLIYRLLRTGEVRVNKGRAKPAQRLSAGDLVRIPPVRTAVREPGEVPRAQIEKLEKTIVYEDKLMLVVGKPSGLAVHGGSGVSFGVIEAMRAARPQAKELELVHRLDRDTSGCLMLAKRRSALRRLQELQRENRVEKRYLALVAGKSRRDRLTVDAPLRKNLLQGGERVVRVDPAGKPSRTRFRVLERFADSMLVEATLDTGRTHQIRVHAAHLGHPLLGDDKYGDAELNQRYKALGLRRLFLHAWQLVIPWGEPERPLKVEAPLPEELEAVLRRLRQG